MPDSSVVFSKLVATPTDTSWSQAYSAGKLFTVLSIKNSTPADEEEKSLKAIGKSVLDALETEFFTLEEKNLESIKGAINEAIKNIPEESEFSFVTAVVSENILYSYIVGKGKIFIKRGPQFGYVLESDTNSKEVSSASGFLQNNDLIILATDGFCQTISKDQLTESIQVTVPSEIAESLAPSIHETEESGAAAIILSFKEDEKAQEVVVPIEQEKEENAAVLPQEEPASADVSSSDAMIEEAIERNERRSNFFKNLSHSKKVYLTILVLVIGVIMVSVFLGIQKQNEAKVQAAFDSFYPAAQKNMMME